MDTKAKQTEFAKMGGRLLGLVLALSWLLGNAPPALTAITSPLYITGDTSAQQTDDSAMFQIFVLQGTSVINTWAKTNFWEGPIAVADTVRTIGIDDGAEYTLSGVFTGTTYPGLGLSAGAGFFDGTTDGTNNYAARYDVVYRFDRDWTNWVPLFENSAASGYAGITYDPSNDSLWLSDNVRGVIENRSLTGELLSSFSAFEPTMLALDYADGTLWTAPYDGNILNQYSRTGTLLSSQTFLDSLGKTIWFGDYPGGEFQLSSAPPTPPTPIPAPSSLVLAGCGLAALAFRRLRPVKAQNRQT